MTRLLVAPEGAPFADLAARAIDRALRDALVLRGSVSLALAGGSTPLPVYRRLAELAADLDDAPWARTTVFFGDERAVPFQSPDSNFRAVNQALLERLPTPPAAVRPMPVLLAAPLDAPAVYARLLPRPLDVLLVGMGADGHILSLFPGGSLVASSPAATVAWAEGPVAPQRRMTLTPVVVEAARVVLVLVSGAHKADLVARVLTGVPDASALPAALVRDRTWILDEPAASRLPSDLLVPATRSPEAP